MKSNFAQIQSKQLNTSDVYFSICDIYIYRYEGKISPLMVLPEYIYIPHPMAKYPKIKFIKCSRVRNIKSKVHEVWWNLSDKDSMADKTWKKEDIYIYISTVYIQFVKTIIFLPP